MNTVAEHRPERSIVHRSTFDRIFALCIVNCAWCISLFANTYYASPTGSSSAACTLEAPGTLASAFSKMTSATAPTSWDNAHEVVLLPGSYSVGSTLTFNRNYLALRSQSGDSADVVLYGPGGTTNRRALNAANYYVRVSGITVSNFYCTGDGGAITCSGKRPLFSDCLFIKNSEKLGGGVAAYGTFENCRFLSNTASGNGGALFHSSASNCVFAFNKGNSGGACNDVTLTDCILTNNTATGDGGACYSCTAQNCRMLNNTASKAGGACSRGTYTGCVFVGNRTYTEGGGGYYYTFTDCVFTNNTAAGDGGACLGTGYVARRCEFVGNRSGIKSDGTTQAKSGGACSRGTYYDCRFIANLNPTQNGGGLYYGNAYDCVFIGNTGKSGGGTYLEASGKALRCVFEGNGANDGGAAYQGVYENCLFDGNSSSGAGTIAFAISKATMRNCTVVNNRGVNAAAGNASSYLNTLFHGNTPYDIGSSATANATLYGSLKSGVTLTGSGNIRSSEPLFNLGRYPSYPDYALLPKSPARDKGSAYTYADPIDLAGNGRLYGPAIDIGCYELWPVALPTRLFVR